MDRCRERRVIVRMTIRDHITDRIHATLKYGNGGGFGQGNVILRYLLKNTQKIPWHQRELKALWIRWDVGDSDNYLRVQNSVFAHVAGTRGKRFSFEVMNLYASNMNNKKMQCLIVTQLKLINLQRLCNKIPAWRLAFEQIRWVDASKITCVIVSEFWTLFGLYELSTLNLKHKS